MKHVLLFLFLVIILLPGIQKKITHFKETPLKGAFTLSQSDTLTITNWYSSRFQQSYTAAVNDAIGFRTTLIRLYNQINFSLFNQSSVGTIVVGKSGYLYEEDYIKAYIGKDKLSRRDLEKKIGYISQVQKLLENKGVHFILVFAPSKARIFPDYIPSRYFSKKKSLSNYEEYIQIIRQEFPGLHVIDVNAYFNQLKKTAAFPVYPKGGTHWTNYALHRYFMDSLVHYMGSLRGKRFPVLKQQNLRWSYDLQSPDDDIWQTLNLFLSKDQEKLPYADFSFAKDPVDKKPGLLMISDSYYSMLYTSEEFNSLLSKNNFWYYNKTRYPEEFYQGKTDPAFLRDDLLQHDFVILMATETNIDQMFFFPEKVLSWLGLEDSEIISKEVKRQQRIQYYIDAIYNNLEWLNNIKGQVKKANKSLEELIRDNAEYMEKKEHETH
jgi:hypothetical protein